MARSRSRSNAEVTASADPTAASYLHSMPRRNAPDVQEVEEVDLGVFVFDETKTVSQHSSPKGPAAQPSSEHGISRVAGLRALEHLRRRLNTIDEHSRELRNARHILINREQSLVDERDELVDTLNSIELAILSSSTGDCSYRVYNENFDDSQGGQLPKRKAIADPATDRPATRQRSSESIRQAAGGQHTSPNGPSALRPLATEPTLIQECPPEFLNPSSSLPRPLETTPPSSFTRAPAPSPRSGGSITRNGIRFPPGSAPRPHRSRSSSPFTQMLPPPVPPSPVTPVPTKVYNPIIRCILEAESPTGAAKSSDVGEVTLPALPALSTLRIPEDNQVHSISPGFPKDHHGSVPIYLMLNNPDSALQWSVSQISPERTPSPPIGSSRLAWNTRPRPDASRRYVEEEGSVLELRAAIKSGLGKSVDLQGGPASRTRARVGNAGVVHNKGKGRA